MRCTDGSVELLKENHAGRGKVGRYQRRGRGVASGPWAAAEPDDGAERMLGLTWIEQPVEEVGVLGLVDFDVPASALLRTRG